MDEQSKALLANLAIAGDQTAIVKHIIWMEFYNGSMGMLGNIFVESMVVIPDGWVAIVNVLEDGRFYRLVFNNDTSKILIEVYTKTANYNLSL